ncbi:putative membrane protein [Marinobacterium lacunae]|uniref:Putative membrane protein n=1 Tax=Marinobacterium lacunae TaxID=1232683 RepID=A0A081G1J9_9GAMM|nr:DUF4123 domain-containing protein [Marinobacterium lacunae]KEA64654.1 putative membrane protein [Marinobacterium lacunae]
MEGNLISTVPAFDRAHTQQLYLIVDGGQIEDLAPQLYALEGELEMEFIYLKAPYDHLMEVSPCVIRATEPVKEWFLEQNAPTAGYLFASSQTLEAVASLFRAIIEVESPLGSNVFLKMAHSEVAHILLETRTPALWMIVETGWLPTRYGWQYAERPTDLALDVSHPIKLTDDQWQRFGAISWRNRLEEVQAHLRHYFPQCLDRVARPESWIAHHAETAYNKGFTTLQEQLIYFNILGWLGDDAFTDRYPDIQDLIETRSARTPGQRLEQAAILAERYTHKEMHT